MKRWLCVLTILAAGLFSLRGEEPFRIVVDKPAMTLRFVQGDSLLFSYPMACGKHYGQKKKVGDMRTPEGTFTVVEVVDSRKWVHDFGDGKGRIRGSYGPWFIRLSYGKGIGIHGTHDPASMGKRATEGCVRLRNEDIEALKPYITEGMTVEILPDTIK